MATLTCVDSVSRLAQQTASASLTVSQPPGFSIVVVETEQQLMAYQEAWDDLARNALEPNVFYESWMFLPAVRALGDGVKLQFVLVLTPGSSPDKPVLCGFFPLERRRGYKHLPVSYLTLWRHLHCFLCVPLLRQACAAECLKAFLDWLPNDPRGSNLMEWPWIAGDGPFHQLLVNEQRTRLGFVDEQFTRGVLRPRGNAEAYLQAVLPSRQRKDLRRKEKHLREVGHVEYRTLQTTDDVEPWIDTFLRLEASGWKGAEGSALAANPLEAAYFRSIAREAFRRGHLRMLALFVNGQAIASKCNFVSGSGSFAFKIAFDENWGRSSPGLLLEIANILDLHERREVQWMDACSDAGPSMFDRIWLDRRVIQTMMTSSGGVSAELVVALLPLLRWLKRGPAWLKGLLRRRPASMNSEESDHDT